jgi:hypothetical protein
MLSQEIANPVSDTKENDIKQQKTNPSVPDLVAVRLLYPVFLDAVASQRCFVDPDKEKTDWPWWYDETKENATLKMTRKPGIQ